MKIIYKQKTEKSFNEALDALKSNLTEVGFGVLWEMNFKDKFDEKKLEFQNNFLILEVCNPLKAHQVLLENIELGFFLPCKIAIYEDQGDTFIGMPKPTELMRMVSNNNLDEIANDVENALKTAIDKSV